MPASPALPTACPQCGAALPLALPGVLAVQCVHCGAHFVAGVAAAPASTHTPSPLRTAVATPPSAAVAHRESDTRDLQDRLRSIRYEMEGEELRLSRKSWVRDAVRGLLGLAGVILLLGFFPHSCTEVQEVDQHAAYLQMLAQARAAKVADGTIPVTVEHKGVRRQATIKDIDIVTPGTVEEGRFTAFPVAIASDETREAFRLTGDEGWIFSRVEDGSAAAASGFREGDVLLRVGTTSLPAVPVRVSTTAEHPWGNHGLKMVALLIAGCAWGLHRLRASRKYRLRAAEADLVARLDERQGLA